MNIGVSRTSNLALKALFPCAVVVIYKCCLKGNEAVNEVEKKIGNIRIS